MSEGMWSFGNGSYGRLGHGDTTNQFNPTLIRSLRGKIIAGAASGGDHCIVFTTDNEVYSFGRGNAGALGTGDNNNRVVPTKVQGMSKKEIAGCAAGLQHSIVWTTDNDVYACGSGKEGQLGLGDTDNRMTFTLVRGLSGKQILGVSCGDAHTVAWTADGVYSFGHGKYGQLGHGETKNILTPTPISVLTGKKIVGAACGASHTVVWTEEDEVFSFGYGKYGQLGHGDTSNQLVPTLVQSLRGRAMAGGACGQGHTVLWTTEGEVCSFGLGGNGQLGSGDKGSKMLAARIPFFKGKKVAGAECGANHTFVWTPENDVFSFGCGSYGQLGGGDTTHRLVPTKVAALSGKNLAGVSCGGATLVWTTEKEVPTLLKGLDQVAVQQLHNILQTATPQPGENQHPLITANLATLKETVMDKELNVFVNCSESLAEMLPSTHEDGQQAYLRLQLEKATQKRDAGLSRSDVVGVVEEERKIVDFRTQLLQISQEQPKRVSDILEKAEDGVPQVIILEEKVKLQQHQTQEKMAETEDHVTECTKVLNEEHSSLQEAKAEVERLKRELQQAEMDVVRQQDRVSQADRTLAETKAKVVAYQSVIQACENTLNLVLEAHEQRVDLTRQLQGILSSVQEQQEREELEQSQYFTSVLPEFEERARYYVQRAEQARKMIDPRLEKEMHSVAGVMQNLIGGCHKAMEMLPEELRQVAYIKRPEPPVWSGSTTASETPRLTSYNLQHYYRDDDNISIAPSITPSQALGSPFGRTDALRRSVIPPLREKPGNRYLRNTKDVKPTALNVTEGLKRYAEAEELPKCSRLVAQFEEKTEDFEADGEEMALAKAAYWLYTTDTWVFDQVNNALMNDTGIALSDLGAYIKVLNTPLSDSSFHYTGVVYKRCRLTENQLTQYSVGKSFTWPAFVSTSTEVDKEELFGRQLFIITIPPALAACAQNITPISAFPEEEIVLQAYMSFKVTKVTRGQSVYANVDDVVELELVPTD
mmetsp:Transcript_28803/g.51702  ORF Transcript_28803/g.51702 Transcript_28803/m.51702 type:complete len:989 (-) Transcript_28803:130-3096(-)